MKETPEEREAAGAEEEKRFNAIDSSFWGRLKMLVNGLQQRPDTAAYKMARIELQRLAAPVTAVILPVMIIAALCMASASRPPEEKAVAVEIAMEAEEMPELEEPPPPETEKRSEDVDVDVDLPSVETAAPEPAAPALDQTRPPQNAVLNVRSPVMIRNIFGRNAVGGRGGVGFGFATGLAGDMVGVMYDLKRDGEGKSLGWNPSSNQARYFKYVKEIVEAGLTPAAFSRFYKVGKKVYLSHLFVPQTKAELAPKIFQVEGLMEPRGWVAHYTGFVQPRRSGTFRFVGQFDDYIGVLIDGKVVLEATWRSACKGGKQIVSGWEPREHRWAFRAQQQNQYLTFGDWVAFDASRRRRIDILCGECPGGLVGGILLLEEKGVDYKKGPDGRPVLPPFASGMLSMAERRRLRDSGYAFETERIPVMDIKGMGQYASAGTTEKDDIQVDAGDL